MSDEHAEPGLRMKSPAGRRLIATTVLGSGVAFLDGTVANVALPRIGREFDASLAGLQWVVNGYTLALAALIIVGGSLGDRWGRKKVYGWGIAAFAVTSVITAISPSIEIMVGARVLQGVAAALVTPGALAMLQASFVKADRMKAIGAWTGTLGIATAAGPVVGGWLVDINWRIAFAINVPLCAAVLWLLRSAPESKDTEDEQGRIDITAAVLAPIALAGITWALTAWPNTGPSATTLAAGIVGVVAAVVFVFVEKRVRHPMVVPSLFASRVFSAINLVTLVVYAGLSGSMFMLAVYLQISAKWSALEAGAATLPISIVMFFLASRFGSVATRYGALLPMLGGGVLVTAGFAFLATAPDDPSYVGRILPGVLAMGLGLSMLVAPLTGTVLAAAPDSEAGVASGINNAISRAGGLIAIAALPLLVGLKGDTYRIGHAVADAYRASMWWCAGLAVVGMIITLVGLWGTSHAKPQVTADGDNDSGTEAQPDVQSDGGSASPASANG